MHHTINQILIFLGASLLFVPVLHRIGFGSVLGYLLAGILVGPSGLKFVNDSETAMHIGELGVVLLLFIIGLEIQPQKLKNLWRKLLGLGVVQVLGSSVIFSLLVHLIGLSWPASFFVGFSLSLSSTAFAMQTLIDRHEQNTDFGQGAFAILLTQDLVAIPALALVPLLLNQQQSGTGAMGFIYFLLLVPVLFLISRHLLRPLFRLIADTHSRDIFTAITLFLVLGVASLMVNIGLSAALGTFIAGVMLADSEYRHELEANLDPFKSLLMGLFFMSVGMGVSLSLIYDRPVILLFLSCGYFALKWFIITVIGRIQGMNQNEARKMGLHIAQGGEFAFVLFSLTTGSQILPYDDQALLTAIITLSMMLSPVMNFLYQRFENYRNRIQVEPKFDRISNETPRVIIAGFGRFGQIFGRLLRSQGIGFVAIDHDSDQIELLRKFGNKVYYGDVTRQDILHSAGAESAEVLVLAIDEVEASLATVELVQKHYPHLKIFARARNRGHAFELLERGIETIKRETLDSAMNFTGDLLTYLGQDPNRVETIIRRFKKHDELMFLEQFKVRKDDKMFVSLSAQGTAQLAQVLSDESEQSYISLDKDK